MNSNELRYARLVDCFSTRLEQTIKENKVSKKKIAKDLGINPQAISNYTKMERLPRLEIVVRLAEYFNVSVDWLLGIV